MGGDYMHGECMRSERRKEEGDEGLALDGERGGKMGGKMGGRWWGEGKSALNGFF